MIPLDTMPCREDRLVYYARVLGAEDRAAQRWLALHDLFFLLTQLCERRDLNHDWLFARCREVQASPNGHLDLWAREHAKTSIISFGKTIQDILADPEITVAIFSHTRPYARAILRQIKFELERNERLQELFPDVLWTRPRREAPKWSEEDGLIVRRASNPKEATLEAWGLIDGLPTGKHFRLRVYDDALATLGAK